MTFMRSIKSLVKCIGNLNTKLKMAADEVLDPEELLSELFTESDISQKEGDEELEHGDDEIVNKPKTSGEGSQFGGVTTDDGAINNGTTPSSIIGAKRFPTQSFQEYDTVEEVAAYKKAHGDEPFIKGKDFWEIRRSLWLQGSVVDKTIPQEQDSSDFKAPKRVLTKDEVKKIVDKRVEDTSLSKIGVTPDDHKLIYNYLVRKNKKLKHNRPINLKELTHIIHEGWDSSNSKHQSSLGTIGRSYAIGF